MLITAKNFFTISNNVNKYNIKYMAALFTTVYTSSNFSEFYI